jgi:hypothetical protein
MCGIAKLLLRVISLFTALAIAAPAHARIALVIGEPFGSFGTMVPVGHAGIFLDHVCADTPTHLRPCQPGESGVVLARYHDLRHPNLDWMAVPAFTFFYGVDSPAQVPSLVTPALEAELRENYRKAHLLTVAPDRVDKHGIAHRPRYGDWEEGIGAAFDRRLLVYSLRSTPAQDAAILALLNDSPNRRRYTIGRANCADFAADLLSVVLPGVFHRNVLGDFDMTTPKNLARQLDAYGEAHPELGLQVYEVPQLPGTLRRSRPFRGAAETFVKTKRYVASLLVLQPDALLADWIIYEAKGRWTPGRDAAQLAPANWLPTHSSAAAIASSASVNHPTPSAQGGAFGASGNGVSATYSPLSTDSSTPSEAIGLRAK